jgi:hypothetical protein
MRTLSLLVFIALCVSSAFAYLCSTPTGRYVGESHECVALVKAACNAPATKNWRKGGLVKGNWGIPYGTAIATFAGSKYGGHAAIYLGQTPSGIQVVDQWNGQPSHKRTIHFDNSRSVVNNGNLYYVIN